MEDPQQMHNCRDDGALSIVGPLLTKAGGPAARRRPAGQELPADADRRQGNDTNQPQVLHTSTGKCTDRTCLMIDVKAYADVEGIPYKYVLLDSW